MAIARVLLVDDDEMIRYGLTKILEGQGFEITSATSVPDALTKITTQQFDVLLSDLHMPSPGDGLTVVTAMRQANPRAVTLLLSSFPQKDQAAEVILLQADQILVKPVTTSTLLDTIAQRLKDSPVAARITESVGTILQREMETVIHRWYRAVEASGTLMAVDLSFEERSAYLFLILSDLNVRLNSRISLGSVHPHAMASKEHGAERYRQGYTAAMVVEESRFLQVSIFQTLQSNLARVDFSVVLADVMTIADEVDFQLSHMMVGFMAASEKIMPRRHPSSL